MCINVDPLLNGGLTYYFQIKESIKANTNIFSLAQVIVHSTPCRTTIQLCARVALMVGVALFLSAISPSEPQQFSVRFTLNALAVKSIGTMLMHALNLS